MDLKEIVEKRRVELHKKFKAVPGVCEAYFQPPASVKMRYPCIVYHRDGGNTRFADDRPYRFERRYTGTVIDPNPDSSILDYICQTFPKCIADRHWTSQNLNHDTFTIYW